MTFYQRVLPWLGKFNHCSVQFSLELHVYVHSLSIKSFGLQMVYLANMAMSVERLELSFRVWALSFWSQLGPSDQESSKGQCLCLTWIANLLAQHDQFWHSHLLFQHFHCLSWRNLRQLIPETFAHCHARLNSRRYWTAIYDFPSLKASDSDLNSERKALTLMAWSCLVEIILLFLVSNQDYGYYYSFIPTRCDVSAFWCFDCLACLNFLLLSPVSHVQFENQFTSSGCGKFRQSCVVQIISRASKGSKVLKDSSLLQAIHEIHG